MKRVFQTGSGKKYFQIASLFLREISRSPAKCPQDLLNIFLDTHVSMAHGREEFFGYLSFARCIQQQLILLLLAREARNFIALRPHSKK